MTQGSLPRTNMEFYWEGTKIKAGTSFLRRAHLQGNQNSP